MGASAERARQATEWYLEDTARFGLTISGGISLGAYEAGLNWSLVRLLKTFKEGGLRARMSEASRRRHAEQFTVDQMVAKTAADGYTLLLMDMGVEGNNLYTADVTRTLPVDAAEPEIAAAALRSLGRIDGPEALEPLRAAARGRVRPRVVRDDRDRVQALHPAQR